MLLQKVKEFNDEKTLIINSETEKYETIKSKCEEFKNECVSKFQIKEIESLKKENDNLKIKLEEYKNQSKMIEDGIKEHVNLKDKQTALLENGDISPTMKDMEKQNEKFMEENIELRKEMEELKEQAKNISNGLAKYNSDFEGMKKEYEKKANELIMVVRQNKELKQVDPVSISKENEKVKEDLNEIVKGNKDLYEKIALLKAKLAAK